MKPWGWTAEAQQIGHEMAAEMHKGTREYLIENYSGKIKDENTITLDSVPAMGSTFVGNVREGHEHQISPGIYLRKDPFDGLYPDPDGSFVAMDSPINTGISGQHTVVYRIRGSSLDEGEYVAPENDEVELTADELKFLLDNLKSMMENDAPFMVGSEADLLASIIQKLS